MSSKTDYWVKAKVGEIMNLVNGAPFKPRDWAPEGLPIIRIQNLNNRDAGFNYFNGQIAEKFRVKTDDLLFAWSGTPGTSFGAHIWKGGDAWLNQHIFRVDFDRENLNSEFLRLAINQNLADYVRQAHGGAGLAHITKGKFEDSEVFLPPLNEQRRIVAKLDALFEKSRAIREKLDRAPRLLANLQKSILNSILNGQDADNWEEVSLIDLCESDRSLTYGIIKLGDHKEDGIPVLRSSNVRHLALELDGMKRVSPSLSDEYSRTILQGSEVVITVRGTLGGVAAVSHEHVGWNVSREVAVIPLKKSINPEFVALAIASPKSQAWLRGTYKGVAYTGINIADLKLLRIRLPQRSQQDEIVQRFNAALSALQNIGAGIESGINRIEALHASMLSKAFRGELVPQDPNDEPASVLLERIRAQEPQAKPERRGRKLTAV